MSRIRTLVLLASIAVTSPAVADSTSSISFDFPAVEIGASDRRTLERYLLRPGTLGCDLVEFEAGKLVGLIDALDNGEFSVTNSSVRIKIFDNDFGEFQGIHFELGKERDSPGPYSWGGVSKNSPQVSVNFIVDRFHIATMILDAGEIVYRTYVSRSTGYYFVCKTDGTRPPRRID